MTATGRVQVPGEGASRVAVVARCCGGGSLLVGTPLRGFAHPTFWRR